MDANTFKVYGIDVSISLNHKTGNNFLTFENRNEGFHTILEWNSMNISNELLEMYSSKLKTLIYNRIKFEYKIYQTKEELSEFINLNYRKYTPVEKISNALLYLSGLFSYDGGYIEFDLEEKLESNEVWRKYYFTNKDEFVFYIENLKSQGLIEYEETFTSYMLMKLTLDGLTALQKIEDQTHSRNCFVAMSFSPELEYIYEDAIAPAIQENGFIPIIIRKENVDSDKTINDAILAGIKKSRFTIADFTQHRMGVYFEAGYALGRGQKVIYTCQDKEMGKAHFDTRNFQHIVWSDAKDLKEKLILKIQAYILD